MVALLQSPNTRSSRQHTPSSLPRHFLGISLASYSLQLSSARWAPHTVHWQSISADWLESSSLIAQRLLLGNCEAISYICEVQAIRVKFVSPELLQISRTITLTNLYLILKIPCLWSRGKCLAPKIFEMPGSWFVAGCLRLLHPRTPEKTHEAVNDPVP